MPTVAGVEFEVIAGLITTFEVVFAGGATSGATIAAFTAGLATGASLAGFGTDDDFLASAGGAGAAADGAAGFAIAGGAPVTPAVAGVGLAAGAGTDVVAAGLGALAGAVGVPLAANAPQRCRSTGARVHSKLLLRPNKPYPVSCSFPPDKGLIDASFSAPFLGS